MESETMNNVLWIVSELLPPEHECGHTWQFVGVFDTREKAESACTTPNHFYGPATLNEALSDEPTPWLTCTFPHRDLQGEEVSEARYLD